jgi:hypothetical protein
MIASLALAAVLSQNSGPLTAPFEIADPNRLALSPIIDGKIEAEEWDVLASGPNWIQYLQWEPRKLHIAAKLPLGQDLLVSIDRKANGWLVGRDNLEIRFSLKLGKPMVQVRRLNAKVKDGPSWEAANGWADAAAISANFDAEGWTFEATVEDPNTAFLAEGTDSELALRTDVVDSGATYAEPYLPRATTPIKLVKSRSTALPVGLKWAPEFVGREVMPGDGTRIRLTFNGKDDLGIRDLDLRSEGFLRGLTSELKAPFPSFDNKGRAFIDYHTRISPNASVGYRVLRGALSFADGPPAILQTSYRVPPLLDFDLPVQKVDYETKPQTKKFPFYIKSYSLNRVEGEYKIEAPTGWKLDSNEPRNFQIYASRGRIRQVFAVTIPPGEKGTFPFLITATVGQKVIQQRVWVSVPNED